MGFRTVSIENRARLSYSSGYMIVREGENDTKIHLDEINFLMIATTQAYISAYLLSELTKHKIPVVFCDDESFPVGEYLPLYGAYNCSGKVSSQISWAEPAKKRLWKYVVRHKIARQADVLEATGHISEAELLKLYIEEVRSGDPDNREAAAAGIYFSALFGKGFTRDLDQPVNACLNYGYSILLSKVSREIASRGYITHIGINHRGEMNQWNLACDLMEPFRPYIDFITIVELACVFNSSTKHKLINIMNNEVQYKDGAYKMNSAISMYVADCISALERRIDASEISCYRLISDE